MYTTGFICPSDTRSPIRLSSVFFKRYPKKGIYEDLCVFLPLNLCLMAIINIETATTVCSVAIADKGQIVFEKVSYDGPSHASLLGVFVEEAVNESKVQGLEIDAVAVSSGPGSYTGLRIGVSMAKGLCYGWHVPLLRIPTLDILASKVIQTVSASSIPVTSIPAASVSDNALVLPDSETMPTSTEGLFCAMLDARRMEVYAAIYDGSLRQIRGTEAEIVTEASYATFLEKQIVYFFGNGAGKCKGLIQSSNAVFVDDVHPLASEMALLSKKAYDEKKFEDVAYFEPFYLKDFIATVAKNKLLPEK